MEASKGKGWYALAVAFKLIAEKREECESIAQYEAKVELAMIEEQLAAECPENTSLGMATGLRSGHLPMSTYTIDELSWVDGGRVSYAMSALGQCSVHTNSRGFWRARLLNGELSAPKNGIEEAKAAAQADYISRLEQWLTKVGE